MSRLPLVFLGALAMTGCAIVQPGPAQPSADRVEGALVTARSAADTLQRELVTALTDAIAQTGPGGAVNVCKDKAQEIATRMSKDMSVDIGRTSQRVRNPANAPDAWEKEQLASFAAALASGQPAAGMERHVVERAADGWQVRWMRPIILQPMCATCHGKDIDPGLTEVIGALYPQDAATGFAPGDLRGAFTASVSLTRD
jgi:hypothetical protein